MVNLVEIFTMLVFLQINYNLGSNMGLKQKFCEPILVNQAHILHTPHLISLQPERQTIVTGIKLDQSCKDSPVLGAALTRGLVDQVSRQVAWCISRYVSCHQGINRQDNCRCTVRIQMLCLQTACRNCYLGRLHTCVATRKPSQRSRY